MSSAGRPTFVSAKGGADQGGNRMHVSTRQYSSKDLAGHTKMKQRQVGQNTSSEIAKRDLKRELEDKERKVAGERGRKDYRDKDKVDREAPVLAIKDRADRSPDRRRDKNIDADDTDSSDSEDESDDDESDDSEDEEDELLRELERIKKEREQDRLRAEAIEKDEAARRREQAMVTSNPLLNQGGDYSIKRKWYDDAVFKNQARDEPEAKKRFINDTTRNDFARKFMKKYIQ